MSLSCTGQLQIKCKNCGHLISIDCDDLSFDEVERNERNDGTEIHHQVIHNFPCTNCKKTIEVTYDVWEYPDGIKNSDNIEIMNGTVIQRCNVQIQSS
jgi:hypothetical protein